MAEPLAHGARTRGLLILGLFAVSCLPLLVPPILPTVDFYDHVSRYFVLAHLGENAFLGANYRPGWGLFPNIGLDLLATPLMHIAPPLVVAKIVAIMAFAAQYFGVLFLNRQITGRTNVMTAVITIPLLYSFIFVWGFANFLFGLGLALWGAGLWLRFRDRLGLAVLVGAPAAIVIFFAHGVAFGLYGLTLGGFEIGLFLTKRQSLRQLCATLAALAAQGVVPLLIFAGNAKTKVAGGVTNADEAVGALTGGQALGDRIAGLVLYRLETIMRVGESPSRALDLATFALLVAAFLWLLARKVVRIPTFIWPALGLGVLLVALMPPALFEVGYVADRMPLFLGLLLVASVDWSDGVLSEARMVVAGLGLLVLARLAFIAAAWAPYAADYRDFRVATASLPSEQLVAYSYIKPGGRLGPERRCEMYGPLLAPLKNAATPLFTIPGAQPLRVTGRMDTPNLRIPSLGRATGEPARDIFAGQLAGLARSGSFDYLLICDLDQLHRPVPAELTPVASAGRFTLMKIGPRPAT